MELFDDADLGLRAKRFAPGCHIAGFQPVQPEERDPSTKKDNAAR
jgi:hypothetical protein